MTSAMMRAALLATAVWWTGCADAVSPPVRTVATVEVSPGGSLVTGDTLRLTATARASDGTVVEGRAVIWSSEDEGVAQVTGVGAGAVVRATGAGATRVIASVDGKAGWTALAVSPSPVTVDSVMIHEISGDPGSPQHALLEPGFGVTAGAKAFRADGTQIGGLTILWRSADTTVATVVASADGGRAVITARSPGVTTIFAEVGGRAATASVMVAPPSPPAGAITIEPRELLVERGRQADLMAWVWDVSGGWVDNPTVTWVSADTSIVRVTSMSTRGRGRLEARREGTVSLTAYSGGRTATAKVRVKAAPGVASVSITPYRPRLWRGVIGRLGAVVSGPNGGTLADYPIAWSMEDSTVAEIWADGRVQALEVGRTRVFAESGGVRRSAELEVFDLPVNRTALQLLPNVEPGGTPRVTVPVGRTTWVDSNGTVHQAEKWLVGGSLTLALGAAGYEQSLSIDVVVVRPDHSVSVVGKETWTDRGWVRFDLSDPSRYTLVSTARPGLELRGSFVEAGLLSIEQAVGSAPMLQWLYEM